MTKPRKAMFAGSWYPGNADGCEKEIREFLKQGTFKPPIDKKMIGGIVPHAGWYFSGSIACNVIHALKDKEPTDVIVIFGMHLGPGAQNYIMGEGEWKTPFGEIQIEKPFAEKLIEKFPFKIETSQNFIQDNTIELQLPFIKYFFPDTKIVPMGVPPDEKSLKIGAAVAEISKQLGLRVKVIGSTDLTHYGPNYGFLPKGKGSAAVEWVKNENDHKVIEYMLAMDANAVISEALENHNACCSGAVATAISAAKALGATNAESVAYATSYDKSPGSSFVGYVGIVFEGYVH